MESRIKTENFEIENLNPQLASIYPKDSDIPYTGFDKNLLILDFGEKVKGCAKINHYLSNWLLSLVS